MKQTIYFAGISAILIAIICFQFNRINIIKSDRDLYKQNMNSALTECVVWKTKDSLSVAKNNTLTLRIAELEKYRKSDLKTIESLKKKNEDLDNLIKNASNTEIKIITEVRDSIIYVDSLYNTIRVFNWSDNWAKVNGEIYKNEVAINISNKDSLFISAVTIHKRFLGFLWKTKKIKEQNVYAISKNPHTTIENIEYYVINK
mgnify:CR=1 FL=1